MANNYPTNIRVEMPDTIQVTSPELDSVKKSTQLMVDILTKYLGEFIGPIKTLEYLPELLKMINDTVTKNFQTLFTSSVEADVLSRHALIRVLESKAGYVEAHMNKKKDNAAELISMIKRDYNGYFDEVATEHESFLRMLDNHVFELVDKVYPKAVQEKFSFQSLPSVDFLSGHISNSAFARSICFGEVLNETEREVLDFVDSRAAFYQDLEESAVTGIEPGSYNLPASFVEVENVETGEIEIRVFFPWGGKIGKFGYETTDLLRDSVREKAGLMDESDIKDQQWTSFIETIKKQNRVVDSELVRFQENCKSFVMEG